MKDHRGTTWDAELGVFGLECGAKPLDETHQRLLDELNLTEEHFDRLEALITSPRGALRLHQHPNCRPERQLALEQKYPVKELLAEVTARFNETDG